MRDTTKMNVTNKVIYAILLGVLIILGSFFMQKITANAADKESVLAQINGVRTENGLKPLITDAEFDKNANTRAKEQVEGFSHTRPCGKMWYTVSPDVNRETMAHLTAKWHEEVLIDAWMQSKVHKENLLSSSSSRVGIGIYQVNESECYIVVLTD